MLLFIVALVLVAVLAYVWIAVWLVTKSRLILMPFILMAVTVLPVADSLLGRFIIMPLKCKDSKVEVHALPNRHSGLFVSSVYAPDNNILLKYNIGFVERRVGPNNITRREIGQTAETLITVQHMRQEPSINNVTVGTEIRSSYELKSVSSGVVDSSSYQNNRNVLLNRANGKVVAQVDGHAFLGGFLEQVVRSPFGHASSCNFREGAEALLLQTFGASE